MPKKNHLLLLGFAFVVTAVFLGYFIRGVASEWEEFVRSFQQCNWLFLIPAILLVPAVFFVKAVRWQLILKPVEHCRLWLLFSAASIGFMANCILPARAGELVRVAVLGRHVPVRKATILATVVVERIFDLLGLVVVASMGIGWLAFLNKAQTETAWQLKASAGIVGGMGALALSFLVLLRFKPHWARNVAMLGLFWLPERLKEKAGHLLDAFIQGLAVVHGFGQAAVLILISVFHWTLMGLITHFTALCFVGQTFIPAEGAEAVRFHIGLGGAFVVLAIQSVMVMLPQAPGFLGVHQTATSKASQMILGPASQAIANAYAVVLWCVMIVPVVVLGLFCLSREGLSIGQMKHIAEENDQPETPPSDADSADTTSSVEA